MTKPSPSPAHPNEPDGRTYWRHVARTATRRLIELRMELESQQAKIAVLAAVVEAGQMLLDEPPRDQEPALSAALRGAIARARTVMPDDRAEETQ